MGNIPVCEVHFVCGGNRKAERHKFYDDDKPKDAPDTTEDDPLSQTSGVMSAPPVPIPLQSLASPPSSMEPKQLGHPAALGRSFRGESSSVDPAGGEKGRILQVIARQQSAVNIPRSTSPPQVPPTAPQFNRLNTSNKSASSSSVLDASKMDHGAPTSPPLFKAQSDAHLVKLPSRQSPSQPRLAFPPIIEEMPKSHSPARQQSDPAKRTPVALQRMDSNRYFAAPVPQQSPRSSKSAAALIESMRKSSRIAKVFEQSGLTEGELIADPSLAEEVYSALRSLKENYGHHAGSFQTREEALTFLRQGVWVFKHSRGLSIPHKRWLCVRGASVEDVQLYWTAEPSQEPSAKQKVRIDDVKSIAVGKKAGPVMQFRDQAIDDACFVINFEGGKIPSLEFECRLQSDEKDGAGIPKAEMQKQLKLMNEKWVTALALIANVANPVLERDRVYRLLETSPEHKVEMLFQADLQGNLREKFAEADVNHDGFLDAKELKALLEKFGGASYSDEFFRRMDTSKDGRIDFHEFKVWYIEKEMAYLQLLRHAFDRFDRDGNGALDRDELKELLTTLHSGQQPDDEMLDKVVEALDTDRNGLISRTEFDAWYIQSPFWAQRITTFQPMFEPPEAPPLDLSPVPLDKKDVASIEPEFEGEASESDLAPGEEGREGVMEGVEGHIEGHLIGEGQFEGEPQETLVRDPSIVGEKTIPKKRRSSRMKKDPVKNGQGAEPPPQQQLQPQLSLGPPSPDLKIMLNGQSPATTARQLSQKALAVREKFAKRSQQDSQEGIFSADALKAVTLRKLDPAQKQDRPGTLHMDNVPSAPIEEVIRRTMLRRQMYFEHDESWQDSISPIPDY